MTDAEHRPCVLLIDDEATLLEMLGMLLKKRGYEVLTASTVSVARIAWTLHKARIAAVISDTWLSSTENTNALLTMFKQEIPDIPIIVTSGFLEGVDATVEWNKRRINYLPKPFDTIVMFEALEALTGGVR
jgi:DNA-binding NtrC family response regulator